MRIVRMLVSVLFVVTPLVGAVACGPSEDELCHGPDGTLEPGEQYGDACNKCTCNEDFSITCKETADCAHCEFEGEGYKIGDTWPAGDGCNICQCNAEDDFSCTEVACTN